MVTTGNATKDIMNMPIWISEWLKNNFLEKLTENNKTNLSINFRLVNILLFNNNFQILIKNK